MSVVEILEHGPSAVEGARLADDAAFAALERAEDDEDAGRDFDPMAHSRAIAASQRLAVAERVEAERVATPRPVRIRSRARSTRREHRRTTRTTVVASGGGDDPEPEPEPSPSLALRLLDPRAVVRGALLAAVAAAEAALAAYDASFPPVDPIVILRDGCPELGLTDRQLLDAHRRGGFVAAGRPLVARMSAIRAWYEARLEPPPAPALAVPAMDHVVDEDDGVRVVSRLRVVGGAK